MTVQQQRIAIAEACGWFKDERGYWKNSQGHYAINQPHGLNILPNYLKDLNAMHEAIRDVIAGNKELEIRFIKELHAIQDGLADSEDVTPICEHEMVDIISECWWLAEAFLRTIGKWKDQ